LSQPGCEYHRAGKLCLKQGSSTQSPTTTTDDDNFSCSIYNNKKKSCNKEPKCGYVAPNCVLFNCSVHNGYKVNCFLDSRCSYNILTLECGEHFPKKNYNPPTTFTCSSLNGQKKKCNSFEDKCVYHGKDKLCLEKTLSPTNNPTTPTTLSPTEPPTFEPSSKPTIFECSLFHGKSSQCKVHNILCEYNARKRLCLERTDSPTNAPSSPTIFSCSYFDGQGAKCKATGRCTYELKRYCVLSTPKPSISPTTPTPTSFPTTFSCSAFSWNKDACRRAKKPDNSKVKACTWVKRTETCVELTENPTMVPTPPTLSPSEFPTTFSCSLFNFDREGCENLSPTCIFVKKKWCVEFTESPTPAPVTPTVFTCGALGVSDCQKAKREGLCVWSKLREECLEITNSPTASPIIPPCPSDMAWRACEGLDGFKKVCVKAQELGHCLWCSNSKRCRPVGAGVDEEAACGGYAKYYKHCSRPTMSPTLPPSPNVTLSNGRNIRRPNIVIVLVDDMGYGDIRLNNPNSWTKTPNIDALGKDGIVFDHFHSGAVICSPTRASVLTGRVPGRECIDYVSLTGENQEKPAQYFLPNNAKTISHLANSKNYRTAFFGKWHLGNVHKRPYQTPHEFGFDEFVATSSNAATHDLEKCWSARDKDTEIGHYYPSSVRLDWPANVDCKLIEGDRLGNKYPVRGWGGSSAAYLTERTLDFVDRVIASDPDQPFLVEVAHWHVHTPFLGNKNYGNILFYSESTWFRNSACLPRKSRS